ncbi:DUF2946 domain-containing protein [Uliginosibacterium sp. H1]|uniref:DUF2946 domain-containing protein n=1 Tax=Uliginosibacterium sp. H1 TaxID=3114757 RepID=UPI002E18D9D5|nr:DUF2946 domain-containing protein [Uliginosibacterium sp. H1]
MFHRSSFQRFVARLALLAVLLAALAPTVSRALISAGLDDNWVEICADGGSRWLKMDTSSVIDEQHGPSHTDHTLAFEHCPFCTNQATQPGLPPSDPPALRVATGTPATPPLFLHAPQPLHAWAGVRSRAPPFLA